MRILEKFILPFFFCIVLILNYTVAESQQLSGSVAKGDGKWVYLLEYYGRNLQLTDSAKIKDSKVVFKKNQEPGFYRLSLDKENGVTLILGKEQVVFAADASSFVSSVKLSNSKENAAYFKYLEANNNFSVKVNEINARIRQFAETNGTNNDKFNKMLQGEKALFDSLNNIRQEILDDLAAKEKGSFIASIISYLEFKGSESEEAYLSGFSQKGINLLRGDQIYNRVSIYLQNFVFGRTTQYLPKAEALLASLPSDSAIRELTYQALIDNLQSVDQSTAVALAKKYDKEFPRKGALARYSAILNIEPEVGDDAPDIVLQNADGKTMKLSDLRGKVVLIDFWASWCGPCRRENPNVVKVYEQYKSKGFDIYSVSLDNSKDRWIEAIAKDNLGWPSHVSDLKGWQSAGAALYKVRGIPATFLVDQKGKIIAKNLRGPYLEQKLEELFR
jgi:thiol-disulfide isomerase/thioredoxin